MAYVPIPKDLTRVKAKVLYNLTKRQLICFGSGALVGVPIFFAMKSIMGVSAAAMIMIVIMLPFFLFAMSMYERNGQPMETILWQFLQTRFVRPKQRPCLTDNFCGTIGLVKVEFADLQSIKVLPQHECAGF